MGHKKIHFRLVQGEDGYPPVSVESLWAESADNGTFIIDNIPFYAQGVSLGDAIKAEMTFGALEYVSTENKSNNTTIRISFGGHEDIARVMRKVEEFGCVYERGQPGTLVAVNVPATCRYSDLTSFLNREKDCGVLEYEESALRT